MRRVRITQGQAIWALGMLATRTPEQAAAYCEEAAGADPVWPFWSDMALYFRGLAELAA
jgi:hypothetical protein